MGSSPVDPTKGDFDERLTVIKEDNSAGKTTLAEFIISMFYGLPDLKVKDLRNERRRYDPWQGGVYGGALSFEHEGRTYRIERDFGKNTFRLFDITAVKREITSIGGKKVDGGNLGGVLFEMDKNSFKRSAYIPQDEIICSELDDSLAEKLRNVINATEGRQSLELALKLLQKSVDIIETKRGKGKLSEVEAQIQELRRKIAFCKSCSEAAEQDREALEQKKARLKELEDGLKEYEERIKEESEKKALSAQQSYYRTLCENIRECEERIKKLVPFFGGQNPESLDLNYIRKKIEFYSEQKERVRRLEQERDAEAARVKAVEDSLSAVKERRALFVSQIRMLESEARRVADEKRQSETRLKALEASRNRYRGIIYVLLCILTFGIFHLIARPKAARLNAEIEALQKRIYELDETLQSVSDEVIGLKGKLFRLDAYDEQTDAGRLRQLDLELREEREKLLTFKENVESMLSDFMCESGDYMECSHEIKEKAERFNELNRQLSAYREKLEEFVKDKDIQKLTSRIDDGGATQKLEAEREALDLKRLSIVREITELETRISQNEEAAENLSLYEGEAAQLEERRAHLLNELDALKKAMAFLNEANDNLANRYLMPLLERTRDLLRLYDEGKSQLRIEANSRIMISEGGIDRELDYYSRGIKEIVSICMRIALIEVIYREASYKPFIILDDPFVNLDDQKLLSAKAFIKSLSKKYQIVYLTCHTSRII